VPELTALHELTAAQAARLIRDRKLSPVELVGALLARARAVDAHVRAWETLDGDRALAAARAAEQALANRSASPGPLHGVPFGAKDIFDTAGLRTAAGFGPYRDRVPTRDAEVVARLKHAGAILLGKTVTTQFAFADPPKTRNAWSAERTPGGSSSGSGAGVAAREMPLALGSQTAGSVLRPAAYNGVVGLKPTYGTSGCWREAWTTVRSSWQSRPGTIRPTRPPPSSRCQPSASTRARHRPGWAGYGPGSTGPPLRSGFTWRTWRGASRQPARVSARWTWKTRWTWC
jgi:Asp-tRNA(Asn)/Glu-tRNA(Gln) amidotransferase A subunit family amidase